MKYRKDFVTNSSSSSYTCEICGETVSGWDYGLSEAEMLQCSMGHTFCESHMRDLSKDEILNLILLADKKEEDWCKEHGFSHESFAPSEPEKMSQNDMLLEYLSIDDIRYGVSTQLCPICQFESVSDDDVLRYLLKKNNATRQSILKELKEKFSTYNDFVRYLEDKK